MRCKLIKEYAQLLYDDYIPDEDLRVELEGLIAIIRTKTIEEIKNDIADYKEYLHITNNEEVR